MHVAVVAKALGIKSGSEDSLVAPVAHASPKRDTDLMPCVRQHLCLAFRTVDREEVVRHVIGVYFSDRDDNLTSLDVELTSPESLVDPELLQGNLAAALCLSLVFATLVSINLYGILRAAMLKLNLHTHGPSMSEVIAQVKGDVWQVEASVAIVILIGGRVTVAVEVLAVEVARSDSLAISADRET